MYLSLLLIWSLIAACVRRDERGRSCAKYFSCASSCSSPQTRASCGFLFLNTYGIPRRPLRKKSRNRNSSRMAQGFASSDTLPAIAQKTEILEICFTHFSLGSDAKAPALARSGAMICTTRKTEIILNTKTAGGCGVAPFSSLPSLFRRRQDSQAQACAVVLSAGVCLPGCNDALR